MEGPLASIGWGAVIQDKYMSEGLMALIFREGEFFPAFGGMYMYCRFGEAELCAFAKMEKDGGLDSSAPAEVSVHGRGNLYRRMILKKALMPPENSPSHRPSCFLMEDEWGRLLPVHLFMPWVLPGLVPGQPVVMQATLMAVRAERFPAGNGYAAKEGLSSDFSGTIWQKLKQPSALVSVEGTVTGIRQVHTALPARTGSEMALSRFFILTLRIGKDTVELTVSDELSGFAASQVACGDVIRAKALLSGNVRAGVYTGGMVPDRENYICALRFALYYGLPDFLDNIWSKGCLVTDSRRGGTEQSISSAASFLAGLPRERTLSIVMARRQDKAEPAVLVHEQKGKSLLLFLTMGEDSLISRIDIAETEQEWPEAEGLYDRE